MANVQKNLNVAHAAQTYLSNKTENKKKQETDNSSVFSSASKSTSAEDKSYKSFVDNNAESDKASEKTLQEDLSSSEDVAKTNSNDINQVSVDKTKEADNNAEQKSDKEQASSDNTKAGNDVSNAKVDTSKLDSESQTVLQNEMQAEIDKLESEYNIAENDESFFGGCLDKVKGFFGKGSIEKKEKIDKYKELLKNAKNDPSKLNEAYSEIMQKDLTNEDIESLVQSNEYANSLSVENKEELCQKLKEQSDNLSKKMDETVDDQGWFSKKVNSVNNFLGLGTSEKKAKAQISEYQKLVNNLDPNDPDFASKYKQITGEELSEDSVNALTSGSNMVSKGEESIYDYKETQETGKEVATGVVTGAAVVVSVVAAPLTGGASIALGAAVGGATNTLINGTDTIGTSQKYSFEEGVMDFASGAIDGTITAATMGSCGLSGRFSKKAGEIALKQTAKKAAMSTGKRLLTSTARSVAIAEFNTIGNYALDTVAKDALYDATENYTVAESPSQITQNDDGTYSFYHEVTDSKTGKNLYYQIDKVDSYTQDENGNYIKGNVLETSKSNDFDVKTLGKQMIVSGVAATTGSLIGNFTGGAVNPFVKTATNSGFLAGAAEIATDATLSLGADYLLASAQRGEFISGEEFFTTERILSEGRNQLRGLLIGLANSKTSSRTSALEAEVASMMKSGDIDGATKLLKSKGYSSKDIDSVKSYVDKKIQSNPTVIKTEKISDNEADITKAKSIDNSDVKKTSGEIDSVNTKSTKADLSQDDISGTLKDDNVQKLIEQKNNLAEKMNISSSDLDEFTDKIYSKFAEANTSTGWEDANTLLKSLSTLAARSPETSSEIKKYTSGEYSKLLDNVNYQPKDLINLVQNKEYGENLNKIVNACNNGDKEVKLNFDGKDYSFDREVVEDLTGNNDGKYSFANLATQEQYCKNLEDLSKNNPELLSSLRNNVASYDVNKILTLGDCEFSQFSKVMNNLEDSTNKLDGFNGRNMLETTGSIDKTKSAEEISSKYKGISYNSVSILANAKLSTDSIDAAINKLGLKTSDINSNVEKIRCAASLLDVKNTYKDTNSIEYKTALYNAINENSYYLTNGKTTNSDIKLLQIEGLEDGNITSCREKLLTQLNGYASEKYTTNKDAQEGIKKSLGIEIDEFKNCSSKNVAKNVVDSILKNNNAFDNFDVKRDLLIAEMKKLGVETSDINDAVAKYDIAYDVNKLKTANDSYTRDRILQDISIVLANNKQISADENTIKKYLKNELKCDFKDNDYDDIIANVSDIIKYQTKFDQTKISDFSNKSVKVKNDKMGEYSLVDLSDGEFTGYVYALGASNKGINVDTIQNALYRTNGYKEETVSTSYINGKNSSLFNDYNYGLIVEASDNSLVCAGPADLSTHMNASRDMLANYYFLSDTMDVNEQGKVYNYRLWTKDYTDSTSKSDSTSVSSKINLFAGNGYQSIFVDGRYNEALINKGQATGIFYKGSKDSIPSDLIKLSQETGLPIVLIS